MTPHPFSPQHQALLAWYRDHGRHDLPWRNTADAYAILVSEVMLQQTQVKTVLERYYFPFLKRFPTLQALAAAPEVDVLKAWEGLGYYQRARNLHKAAKQAGERLPNTVEALMSLPGIGKNTAHAVAAFAYRQSVPVLEANVKRVVRRFFALANPSPNDLWLKAETLQDREKPFDYNQAMMDLGAMICTPKAPLCNLCPLAGGCRGKHNPHAYDPKPATKVIPIRHQAILLYASVNRLGLERNETRLLGGLYGFPQCPLEQEAAEKEPYRLLGTVRHTYSHFKLLAEVRVIDCGGKMPNRLEWYSPEEIKALPLSRVDQKALDLYRRVSGEVGESAPTTLARPRKRSARLPAEAPS